MLIDAYSRVERRDFLCNHMDRPSSGNKEAFRPTPPAIVGKAKPVHLLVTEIHSGLSIDGVSSVVFIRGEGKSI